LTEVHSRKDHVVRNGDAILVSRHFFAAEKQILEATDYRSCVVISVELCDLGIFSVPEEDGLLNLPHFLLLNSSSFAILVSFMSPLNRCLETIV
jgi:hypothetical protein